MDLDQRAKRASIIENTTVKKNTDWLQYERTLRAKMGEKCSFCKSTSMDSDQRAKRASIIHSLHFLHI